MRKICLLLLTSVLSVLPGLATAQTIVASSPTSLSGHFFVSVIAGVVIAVGIQFLLSNLAIASGISAIGDVQDTSDSSSASDSSYSTKKAGQKLSAALGIFTIVTMSISLFIATYLAIELSLVSTVLNGAILGVVVWALFFITAVVVDIKLTTAVCGNLLSFLRKGIAGASDTVISGFAKSEQAKAQSFAKETVKAIHEEVRSEFNTSDFDKKVKQYIDRATQSQFSAKDLRKEMEKLINEIEVEEKLEMNDSNTLRKLILDIASNRPSLDEDQKKKVASTYDDIKGAISNNSSNQDRATDAFDKLSPGDEEKGRQYRAKFSSYLDESDQEEITPEKLQEDMNAIFDNPKNAQRIISNRASKLDRNTLKALIESHPKMDSSKTEKLISTYDKVVAKFQSNEDSYEEQVDNLPAKRSQLEQRIQKWFDSLDRPELAYRNLKSDFMDMLDNPTDAPEIALSRMKKMDERSLRALLTNNDRLSNEDIDEYIAKYNEAREELITKLESMKDEIDSRVTQMKDMALRETEAVRATAASAAWWLFASALVSLASATVAGAIATNLI
ncbi:hypothetical protein C7Y69_17740 [Alteromonas sp. KS69]|jgi:uncharacterized membrane protein YcgQ (UPF0703/DUF1980 family)|uniref:hypothetical protein n=1 Tax=Alteromonas sp. KS69 TaxID=2109917 RepID=UPI000F877527|nr:hypothetical protein [Alteromonas sp. KS69]RUP76315.1 hypothetical protein C7Y69_17740 [Alteromonas sp. KS69]